jgi:signal transduction histidine kinase/ligand-binding sensor domain-containing protein
MKMQSPFSLSFLVWFLCSGFVSIAQDIRLNIVTPPIGEAGFTTNGMAQDKQGYIWLATSDGLYKYDGYQYTPYHHETLNSNTPAGANTEWVMADKAGYIWLALHFYGLDRLDPATGIFTHFRHHDNDPGSLINDTVWVVVQDHEGTIWIGTAGGLDKFDSKTNKFIHHTNSPNDPSSLSSNEVRAIYEDKQGTIWVGTGSSFFLDSRKTEGGLNKLNKNTQQFTRYLHDEKDPHTLIDNRVRSIFEDSRGNFWIGTAEDGLHTMDRAKGTFERHTYDSLHPDKLSRPPIKNIISYGFDHITFITEDKNGKIWIGTFEGGLNVYDPVTQKAAHYDADKNSGGKLVDNSFWTAYKTRDDILWISAFSNNLYKTNPYQNILPHIRIGKWVICLVEDGAHGLWLTTLNGLIHKYYDGREENFLMDKNPSSPLNQFYFIEKNESKFWVTSTAGLLLFDTVTKTFSSYRHQAGNPNSIISDSPATLKKNVDNTMWVCTARGLDLMDIKTGTFRHFLNNLKDSDSIPVESIFSVTSDKFENLWVGTLSGLYRLDKQTGQFKRYLNKSFVSHIFEDSAGTLWAATDAGLFTYNKEADNFFIFIDESSAITGAPVFWIAEDNHQNLWISSASKGLIRLNKERNSTAVYGRNQGVSSQSMAGSYVLVGKNGEILIADTSGYYNFQPDVLQQHLSSPVVSITKFLLNNIPVPLSPNGILSLPLAQTKVIRLGHDQNTFSFELTNIDFSSEHEDTRLLYMLQNYDNTWRKAGDERTAYYFNLPPGKYIFKVKALNDAGIAAEKNIAVIISSPWWKTWWAYSLAALLVAVTTYTIYRNRTNQLKRNQAAQINTMVAAQEGERKRISRDLHDDVGTKLSALKLFLSSLHEKATSTNNEEIKSLAESSEQFITEVMQDVRQLLLNLSPAVLEEFGYATAVEGLVNKINETKQIHFNLVMFGMKDRLQKDYELALYRITQELINNVLKHAAAKNVSLQIGQRDEKIVLMIEDDGKGFDVNAHKDGYGLHNLEARTQLMQGTMVIDSQPGKGTSVLIEIPYNFN